MILFSIAKFANLGTVYFNDNKYTVFSKSEAAATIYFLVEILCGYYLRAAFIYFCLVPSHAYNIIIMYASGCAQVQVIEGGWSRG